MLPVCAADEMSLTYDANGNLVTGDGNFRVYNSLNQLHKVYNGTDATGVLLEEFVYHPTEERVLVKKVFEQNGNGSLQETVTYVSEEFVRVSNGSGSFDYTYVMHEGQKVAQEVSGTKHFMHDDHLGSTSVITNASGDVIENTTYSPYGEIISGGSVSRFDYEGREYDSVVQDYDFHFRKYKPEWGMFTQPDKIVLLFNPQGLNRYAYELRNPYKHTDPSGKEPVKSQAGSYDSVLNYIRSVEVGNPDLTPTQILGMVAWDYLNYEEEYISEKDKPYFSANFVYTENEGVVDHRHFFANAYAVKAGVSRVYLTLAGYAYEFVQGVYTPWSHSYFTYEDLSSNRLGRGFGKGLTDDIPLSLQYEDYLRSLNPQDFPDNLWNDMPEEENKGVSSPRDKRKYYGWSKGLPRGYDSVAAVIDRRNARNGRNTPVVLPG